MHTVKAERSIAFWPTRKIVPSAAAWPQVRSRSHHHRCICPTSLSTFTEHVRMLSSARVDWEEKAVLLSKILSGTVAVSRPHNVVLDCLHTYAAKKLVYGGI